MARLAWRGRDAHGRRVQGACRADSGEALRRVLAARGIVLERARPALAPEAPRRRPALGERARALRRLAAVLEAGVPLNEALRTVAPQTAHPQLRRGLRAARRAVELGRSPAEALSAAVPGLRAHHHALLEAGSWTGDFPDALGNVAEELERHAAIARQLRRAATYPAIVAVVALGLTTLLMAVIVPRFEGFLATGGDTLPALTRGVLALSEAFRTALPIALAAGTALAVAAATALRRRPRLRRQVLAGLARAPVVGGILLDAALSRWAGTLARLLGAGVPLLEALPTAAGAAGGAGLERRLPRIQRRIRGGEPFADALRHALPEAREAARLAAVGEHSGRLEEMLHEAAATHRARLEERLHRITAWLEPALILAMGLLTAVVVTALYLPVFQMGGGL